MDIQPFKIFTEKLIDNALGVITGMGLENIRFINFATDITMNCDCVPNPGPPVIPDLGIFGSKDPVAIDKVCVDLARDAPGLPRINQKGIWSEPIPAGVEKFHALLPLCETSWQFDASVKNKIGSVDYVLEKL